MKHRLIYTLVLFFMSVIFVSAQTNRNAVPTNSRFGKSSEDLLEAKRNFILEQRKADSLLKAKKESIWEQAVVTESIAQPDGFFTINILNNTEYTIYIYIDGDYRFALKSQEKYLDHKYKNLKSIHAYTFNKEYKWGPIDLRGRTEEDLYWKLTLPEKKDVFADQ